MVIDQPAILAIILAALGFIGNGYQSYAEPRGWPVGREFVFWAPASLAMVLLVSGLSWYDRGWETAAVVIVGGFMLAWLLTVVLRQHVQKLWFAGMIAAAMLTAAAWLSKVI